MAGVEITEEYKLQNYLHFFKISALALIMHCRKFIVVSDIYPPSSVRVSVLSLDAFKSTVSRLAKNGFYVL